MENQIAELINFLVTMFPQNAVLVKIMAALFGWRIAVKTWVALYPQVKAFILSTPTKFDDEMLDKAEKSKIGLVVKFLLDVLFSIKQK